MGQRTHSARQTSNQAPRVAEVLDAAFLRVAVEAQDRVQSLFDDSVSRCESPIESLFLAAMVEHVALGDGLRLDAQVQVENYRVDFVVELSVPGWPSMKVAVECDGHDFHEKTKEQAARDKKRDRDLLVRGFPVVRFTGSELWRNAAQCAEEVVDYLHETAYARYAEQLARTQSQRPQRSPEDSY